MEPLPPKNLAHRFAWTLKRTWEPPPYVPKDDDDLYDEALSLVIMGVREDRAWLINRLRTLGAGRFVSAVLANVLGSLK